MGKILTLSNQKGGTSKSSNEYDYIIIDCQPSLGVLVLNALVAADGVIIPAQTQEFSRKALKAITDIIGQVQAIRT